MNFVGQSIAIEQLQLLANSDRHSVLIDGVSGCGKSYLVRKYAEMLGVSDVTIIEPTVNSIRDTLSSCYDLDNRIVVGVENLDTGVFAASSALLKFLEEPKNNVYVVITVRNIQNIADTIISRSACVSVSPPIDVDIETYAKYKDPVKYSRLKGSSIWAPIRSFKDVDLVYKFTTENLAYYATLDAFKFTDSISNIVWYLGHYPDNSESPVDYVIRYIMCTHTNLRRYCISCLNELIYSRIAVHAVLAKFVFDCKYGD